MVVHGPGVLWYLERRAQLLLSNNIIKKKFRKKKIYREKATKNGRKLSKRRFLFHFFTSPAPSGWKLSPTGWPWSVGKVSIDR